MSPTAHAGRGSASGAAQSDALSSPHRAQELSDRHPATYVAGTWFSWSTVTQALTASHDAIDPGDPENGWSMSR